jgi:hypothetical protein
MCQNPQVDIDRLAVAGLVTDVAAAVASRAVAVRGEVYEVILREIPQLREDQPLLALLASTATSTPACR